MALKRNWLRQTGRISKSIDDPVTEEFFAAVCDRGQAEGAGTTIFEMRVEGQLAASQICFVSKGRLVVHVMVYDLEFEKFSAGQLLLEHSIASSFDHGIDCFDLMAPDDPYKLAWSDDTIAVCDWAFPMSVRGRAWIMVYLGRGRLALKKLQATAPLPVRRLMASVYGRLQLRCLRDL